MEGIAVAVIQSSFGGTPEDNLSAAERLVRQAAKEGARIILLPELFERPYFCKTQRIEYLNYAQPLERNPAVERMSKVAAELGIVLPVSFYEQAGQVRFNSVAIVDADGKVLGIYRKSHIPDGPGYQEKFYFSPGDTGFQVWDTAYGRIGVGICWDQWFPEAARAMALAGADLLLYPTAIGDEPHDKSLDSSKHWQTAMQGHAASNMVPLAAANRVGTESQQDTPGNSVEMSFYGKSFICSHTGEKIAEAGGEDGVVLTAQFDLAAVRAARASWGLFRDRRPDLYGSVTSLAGRGANR